MRESFVSFDLNAVALSVIGSRLFSAREMYFDVHHAVHVP